MGIINARRRPGLNHLMKEAGLISDKIKSENIAYIIVPHLNAAGRILDARIGVELLISRDEVKIAENTAILIQNNRERKRIQEEAFQNARRSSSLNSKRICFILSHRTISMKALPGLLPEK